MMYLKDSEIWKFQMVRKSEYNRFYKYETENYFNTQAQLTL